MFSIHVFAQAPIPPMPTPVPAHQATLRQEQQTSSSDGGRLREMRTRYLCALVTAVILSSAAVALGFALHLLRFPPMFFGILVALIFILFLGGIRGLFERRETNLMQASAAQNANTVSGQTVKDEPSLPLEVLSQPPENLTPINTSGQCVVCWENAASLAFVPCGHKCICEDPKCASLTTCPLCRSEAHNLCKIPNASYRSRDAEMQQEQSTPLPISYDHHAEQPSSGIASNEALRSFVNAASGSINQVDLPDEEAGHAGSCTSEQEGDVRNDDGEPHVQLDTVVIEVCNDNIQMPQ